MFLSENHDPITICQTDFTQALIRQTNCDTFSNSKGTQINKVRRILWVFSQAIEHLIARKSASVINHTEFKRKFLGIVCVGSQTFCTEAQKWTTATINAKCYTCDFLQQHIKMAAMKVARDYARHTAGINIEVWKAFLYKMVMFANIQVCSIATDVLIFYLRLTLKDTKRRTLLYFLLCFVFKVKLHYKFQNCGVK